MRRRRVRRRAVLKPQAAKNREDDRWKLCRHYHVHTTETIAALNHAETVTLGLRGRPGPVDRFLIWKDKFQRLGAAIARSSEFVRFNCPFGEATSTTQYIRHGGG